ncbi:MAG TPA: DEAD/DEAH box helicase [Bacteroidales bacterium]|nr:DEAD/DEAH box helicase [Bacteroidales bacterium]HOM40113.1 DEAD/DEAH box helicase [Bacteroidales bacterium]HPP93374.1 DEAD/DEAH box helicase [Bacteroidales bacterium]HQJ76233.1 DEAD/DEAH box helicase [Bacteroidota bacterium]
MKPTEKYNILEKYFPNLIQDIGHIIQKGKIASRFTTLELSNDEIKEISKAKELCELKILELWNNQESKEFKALCSVYFDLATIISKDILSDEDIFETIKIIAFGYLGEHAHFVKEYLINKNKIDNIEISEKWNFRLLRRCFQVIVSLVIKRSWKDISESINLINQLRNEQNQFETEYLNQVKEESQPYGAAEIISLYHFAKTNELLGQYLLEGKVDGANFDIENKIKYHLKIAREFANASGNILLELLYQYFESFGIKLIRNTIWYTLTGVNHWVSEFNKFITKRENYPIIELLYPQKESILKGELLNPAHRSIVISLPTSSGKTLIAEYKILQVLNEFRERGGWVAYIVPTKALVNQIYIRLNQDLGSIGLRIEKASGVAEIDGFESYLVENKGDNTDFDVLITTYEKLNLLIRQGLGTTDRRPLVLTVVDEAHNIEEKQRGLNLEMLLATIKSDCGEANFLLLTPDIPNAKLIAEWLGGERGKNINIQLDWWQPNERVVGSLQAEGRGKNFDVYLQTLNTVKGTYQISEKIPLVKVENSSLNKSQVVSSKVKFSYFVAEKVLNINSPIVVLASGIDETYQIAEYLYNNCNQNFEIDNDIELLKKFVISELGDDFPLVKYLEKRIAIHSSAIPDEIRQLIELLMVECKLQALVSTTTIAQGINFPISAVIIGSYNYPFQGPMPTRDFWNLAGRVGRVGQQSMGWVGIVSQNDKDSDNIVSYVQQASKDLLSQLESAIEIAMSNRDEDFSKWLYLDERWSAILQYISHLRLQINDLNEFINHLEEKLQATLGYRQISDNKKGFLINKLREYAQNLSLEDARRADSTGFSTVSVRQMIARLSQSNISPNDWQKKQLFSEQNETMKELVGIMLKTYEIRRSLEEIKVGENILDQKSISRLIVNWVNGENISQIANKLFPNEQKTKAIEKTTKAIYKVIANMASWGIAALQKMPTSGIDWDYLSDIEKKKMMNIPAYLLYGVNTDEGVLMRKANIPRSIANRLGAIFKESKGEEIYNVKMAIVNEWLKNQPIETWNQAIPSNSPLTAEEFKKIWEKLNG